MAFTTVTLTTASLGEPAWWQSEFGGNQVWHYLLLAAYLLAALLAPKLVDIIFARYLNRTESAQKTTWRERLLGLLRGPLKLTIFLLLVHIGIKPMNKRVWMQDYLDHGFGILVAVAITYTLVKLVDFGFGLAGERLQQSDSPSQQQILHLLARVVRGFVIVTAALVTAENNGIKVNGILASFGITGLAVALAAQETFSNVLGSIVILADRPFILGDRVKIEAFEGVVEYMGIRSTRLRMANGEVVTIPNRTVAAAAVVNYSKTAQQLTQHRPR